MSIKRVVGIGTRACVGMRVEFASKFIVEALFAGCLCVDEKELKEAINNIIINFAKYNNNNKNNHK